MKRLLFRKYTSYFEVKYIKIKMPQKCFNLQVPANSTFVQPHNMNYVPHCDFCTNSNKSSNRRLELIPYKCSVTCGWLTCNECKSHAIACCEAIYSYNSLFDASFFGFSYDKCIKVYALNNTVTNGFISNNYLPNITIRSDGLYVRVEFMHKKNTIRKCIPLDQLLELNDMSPKPLKPITICEIDILMRFLATKLNCDDDHITDIKHHYVKYIGVV